jgi:hypothetical protein
VTTRLFLAALLAASALGCSSPKPGNPGDYCKVAWDGIPCQTGLVCNSYNICQTPVQAGGACIGDVCAAPLECVIDPSSTTGWGVCLLGGDQ